MTHCNLIKDEHQGGKNCNVGFFYSEYYNLCYEKYLYYANRSTSTRCYGRHYIQSRILKILWVNFLWILCNCFFSSPMYFSWSVTSSDMLVFITTRFHWLSFEIILFSNYSSLAKILPQIKIWISVFCRWLSVTTRTFCVS